MSGVSKINGIALANVGKVNNVAKANLGKVSGITVPSAAYTSANSVFFDGSNDYGKISGLTMPTATGSVSFWFKMSTKHSTQRLFAFTDYDSAGGHINYLLSTWQNNSDNPKAAALLGRYKGGGVDNNCSVKSSSSHHGTGFSRWKGNYDDVYGSWPDFEYNANKLIESGAHSFSPAEGAEHGWHMFTVTWDVNEVYTGKDAQSAHKFRPTASHDGTTTNHTGTMRVYLDGTLRNFGSSRSPSYNYQRTPSGMTEIASGSAPTVMYVGALHSGSSHFKGNMDDLSVFNARLDDDAVTAMYNSGVPIDLTSNSGDYDYSSNLIGYWRFDEGSGTTIADSSSNSNDMTLYNSPAWDNGDAPS